MDSITQAVLGAGIQAALLGRQQGRRALLYGAVLGTIPDLDVLASYPDPVSTMTFHRGYSHSIFVLTALALLMAWLIRKRWPDAPYSGWRLALTLTLVLVTHPILDSFTSYGTQLFWPMMRTPESWSSIFIIDPIYTIPLIAAVLWGAASGYAGNALRFQWWMLGLSTAYLVGTLGLKQVAENRVLATLRQDGVQIAGVFSSPMPLNALLWRVVVKTESGGYVEAVTSVFDRKPPEYVRQNLRLDLVAPLREDALHDRLTWFTDDWLRYDAIGRSLVVTDLRMGMPGYYTFRFVMAERNTQGVFTPITPKRWPSDRGSGEQLRAILKRIFVQTPPLPLNEWAKRNTVPVAQ